MVRGTTVGPSSTWSSETDRMTGWPVLRAVSTTTTADNGVVTSQAMATTVMILAGEGGAGDSPRLGTAHLFSGCAFCISGK